MYSLRQALGENAVAASTGLATIVVAVGLDSAGAIPRGVRIDWFDWLPVFLGLFWLVMSVLVTMLRGRNGSEYRLLSAMAWKTAWSRCVSTQRLFSYLCLSLLLAPFMSAFVALKRSIPDWRPFTWDQALHRLDLLLHADRMPWEWLDRLLAFPTIVVFFDRVYYLWFPIVILTVTWFAWSTDVAIRTRFFVTYFASWFLQGVGIAALTSSAGPCYYADVVSGPSPYGALMARLQEVSETSGLTALRVQDYLWTGFATDAYVIEGISAMPSMHVAMATLFCLAGFRVHPMLGLAGLVFLLCILIGSVALAWHYAVDGYASILLTAVFWTATRPLERMHERASRPPMEAGG